MVDSKVRVYVTRWCFDCRRVTNYLSTKQIPHETINIDQDPNGDAFVRQTNKGFRSVPTIVFPDGSILVEPSIEALANKLALANLL